MKKFLGIFLIVGLIGACGTDDPPIEPTPKRDLLVGNWASQTQTTRTTLDGKITQKDTVFPGINFGFTSTFWVYSDYKGELDTSRYNCDADTLYFIKFAMAFDTLIVEEIDDSSLLLATKTQTGSVNGKIFKQQTLLRLLKY